GRYGGKVGVFIRGGNSNYNLVMINGIEMNLFGGDFDFAPLTVDGLDRVEVIRDPERALYGSNAVTRVIHIVTRKGSRPPRLHLFPGIDLVSRDKQNLFGYQGSYSEQITSRFRQVATGSISTNDYFIHTAFGDSFWDNLRAAFNTRSEIVVSNKDLLLAGFEY